MCFFNSGQLLQLCKKDVLVQGELIMRWITKESDNYIFNYHAESIAEKEIEKIMNMQETNSISL